MRFISVIIAVFMMGFPAIANAISPEGPLVTVKIGDWVEIQSITDVKGKTTSQTIRNEITKINENSVTIKSATFVQGQKKFETEFLKPLLPNNTPSSNENRPVLEDLGEGDETIVINGKSFDCHWLKKRVVLDKNGEKIGITTTVWNCPTFQFLSCTKRIVERGGPLVMTTTETVVNFGYGK